MAYGDTSAAQPGDAVERQLAELRRQLAETRAEVARVRSGTAQARLSIATLASVLGLTLFGGSMTAQTTGQKVQAPFEVVDQGGETLMRVSREGNGPLLRVGQAFMGNGASNSGLFVALRPDKTNMLAMGAYEGTPGFYVLDATGIKRLAGVAQAKVGGGVVYVADSVGAQRMLMSGQGELHAIDGVGRTRATMTQDGAFTARNAAGATVARFGESNGTGKLQLTNSVGDSIVEAGQLITGAGVVRAFPMGVPGMGVIGMPGTFIVGFLGAKK